MVAICIAERFGWTIGEVLSLTFPQFLSVAMKLRLLAYRRALDEVYYGVAAAFAGGEVKERLVKAAGDFLDEAKLPEYTEEELREAQRKMDKLTGVKRDGD